MEKESTIVAVSTPIGRGAIAIVRLSGGKALKIMRELFFCDEIENITPRYMYLGEFRFDYIIEKCFMVYFKAPNTYTGEDIVEFQIHGGEILTNKILEACMAKGARLANAGEFSKRAFLNGKISLDEAEGITQLINSESEAELRANMKIAGGELFKQATNFQEIIKEILAEINVSFDYPENDDEVSTKDIMLNKLTEIYDGVKNIIELNKNSKYLRTGINVALIGKPNVGKSSLLNALLLEERAIVTDTPGTTRDSLTETIYHNGVKINLIDTAGIRDANEQIEKLGIQKSHEYLETADVILLILDASQKLDEEDKKLLQLTQNKNRIIVVNKIDKVRELQKFESELEISAKNNINTQKILEKVYKKVISEKIDYNGLIITNQRNLEILKNIIQILEGIFDNKENSLDLLEPDIKKLYDQFGKITGNTEREDIINLIFSKFCLGK